MATLVVLVVIVITRFSHGGWIVVVLIPIIVWLFLQVHKHYLNTAAQLSLEDFGLPPRIRIHGDSTVYSYRPPYGLQVNPLGTIGKLNALATTCTEVGRKRGWRCRRAALTAAADRLV